MPIPDFQKLMLPMLNAVKETQPHAISEIHDTLAKQFDLTEEEISQYLASGSQRIFYNRVYWAKAYLKMAGLVDNTTRGHFKITKLGLDVLAKNPESLSIKSLKQFPGIVDSSSKKEEEKEAVLPVETESLKTPEELMATNFVQIRKSLSIDLLSKVKQGTPAFFENLVVQLLVRMGYGGSFQEAGKATRLTNDGGIDGIIKEDKLGLDVIYIQAKRWDTQSVGRPDIQSFVGALEGQRAAKGVFITTSKFADSAIDYVKTINKKVILIDGQQLTDYMIDYNLGVSIFTSYELKKMDLDFFEEE